MATAVVSREEAATVPGVRIAEIWRYPVKSAQGESLPGSLVTTLGLEWDRRLAAVDVPIGRPLTARREPALLMLSAVVEGSGVRIATPEGATLGVGRVHQLLGGVGEQVGGQAQAPEVAELVDLGHHRLQPHPSGVRLQLGQHTVVDIVFVDQLLEPADGLFGQTGPRQLAEATLEAVHS